MPPVRKIDLLPQDVRQELDRQLASSAYGNSVGLSDWLAEQGYEISKTSVNNYARQLKRQQEAVRASTEAAKALNEAIGDDAADLSNAIYAQLQSGIHEALMAFADAEDEEDPAAKLALLTKAGRDFAAIGRGNIAGKRFAAEVRAAARAELLREQEQKLEAAVQARGMTADQAAFWREQFLKGQ